MWLKDGSYELITSKDECLDLIEERLGYEIRNYLENIFDTEYDDYWEKEINNAVKGYQEKLKQIKCFYKMITEGK